MCVIRALTKLKIPVIDAVGYPLRFLDDHLNAWRSNHPIILNALHRFKFDLRYAYYQAGLIRAKSVWMDKLDDANETAVLIGQVQSDKALIHKSKGKFLSMNDFTGQIEHLVKKHAQVLYKPHPYIDPETNKNILKLFPSMKATNANFYWLASQDNVTDIYAISSGTCSEAPYFKKTGHFFYEPLYELDPVMNHTISEPVPVAQDWLWPDFWNEVLQPITETKKTSFQLSPFKDNKIRKSLNADWGFSVIDCINATNYK